jgi:DnaJ-class molecular chaperone
VAAAYETLTDPQKRADYDDGKDATSKAQGEDSEEEDEKQSIREEVERKYFPERFKFHPFGDPFIEKRKRQETAKREAERKAKYGNRRQQSQQYYDY